jgi:hypothetical protein
VETTLHKGDAMKRRKFDHEILLLQGGGALGAYQAGQAKDAEFSRATVNARWAGGLAEIRRSAASLEWMQPLDLGPGIQLYFLPPVSVGGSSD